MSTSKPMPMPTGVMRRGATYYYRRVVPIEIRDVYGKREELVSLRTRDPVEARRLGYLKAAEVERSFAAARAAVALQASPALQDLGPDQTQTIHDAYFAHLLNEDEEVRLAGFHDPEEAPADDLPFAPRPSWDERLELQDALESVNRQDYARGRSGVFWGQEVEEVLSWENVQLRVAEGSPGWRKATRALQEAWLKAQEEIGKRNRGEVVASPPIPEAAPVAAVGGTQGANASGLPLLSRAAESWIREKSASWGPKAHDDNRHWIRVFAEVAGDHPIDSYSKAHGRRFKELLQKLPANWSKKGDLRSLSITKAAEKAEALGMPPMSISNANKAIARVQSFWSWAEANYFDGPAPQPLKGLKFAVRANPRDERHPFSPDQLRKIFSAPVYTGCQSLRHYSIPGPVIPSDSARYWLPLLGLFTGARLGELCQLTPADIREEAGIPFIDINDEGDDKQVKTAAALRRIPIHPELLRLGFLSLVAARRKAGADTLFSDLKGKTNAKRGDSFSKHFSRFLKSCGAKTDKTAFHSFRHNFKDACVNGGVEMALANALQGHAQEGMAGRYGDGKVAVTVLQGAIRKVGYLGVPLGHLKGHLNIEREDIVPA